MDYEYEYGRYKKKVEDQHKEIVKLQGMIEGMKQVQGANNAIIAAMLITIGATEENPFVVSFDTIKEALEGKKRPDSTSDQEARVHYIFAK